MARSKVIQRAEVKLSVHFILFFFLNVVQGSGLHICLTTKRSPVWSQEETEICQKGHLVVKNLQNQICDATSCGDHQRHPKVAVPDFFFFLPPLFSFPLNSVHYSRPLFNQSAFNLRITSSALNRCFLEDCTNYTNGHNRCSINSPWWVF